LPKLLALIGDVPTPFQYGNAFTRERISGIERLRIGADGRQDQLVLRLSTTLEGPFHLLYILHTTRTGAPLGRYQSPELDADTMFEFSEEFGAFLTEDSRHDIWLRSHNDNATIVLDRHNLIYAYGPLDRFEAPLIDAGLRRATPHAIPLPHVHYYHAEWDDSERAILKAFNWTLTPLRDEDVQYQGSESNQ
jgi:hypothetical protein